MTISKHSVIQQTKAWINEVVIGLSLCPFASQAVNDNSIDYAVISNGTLEQHLQQLADCFVKLDENRNIETSLIIFPHNYQQFDDYLELLYLANLLLEDLNYAGSYQLASFHPFYLFEGSTEDDASNFTNRSPYPMLHILRESSLEKAIASYENIEQVPQTNIKTLQQIGYQAMQQTLQKITQENK